MDIAEIFDPNVAGPERATHFLAWLEQKATVPLTAKRAALIRWLVETNAAKIPLWLIVSGDNYDPALEFDVINPYFDHAGERYIDIFKEFGFIARYSDLDLDEAGRIRQHMQEYEACIGIIPAEVAFESAAELDEARRRFGVIAPAPDRDPSFDIDQLANGLAVHYGLPRDHVIEYDQFRSIYHSARGIC